MSSVEEFIESTIRKVIREEVMPELKKLVKPTPDIDPMQLLTTDEVAKLLGYQPESIRVLVSKGKLKARKIGGEWRFKRADIQAFIDREMEQAAGDEPQLTAADLAARVKAKRKSK